MKALINRWLPAITLACWSGVLLHFYLSGRITSFLHPVFRPPVLIAGCALAVLALFALFAKSSEECGDDACAHSVTRLTGGKLLTFLGLIFPIVVTTFASQDSFGLVAIENRSVTMDVTGLVAKPTFNSKLRPAQEPLPGSTPRDLPFEDNSDNASNSSILPPRSAESLEVSVIDMLYAAQDTGLQEDFRGRTVEMVGQLMAEPVLNPQGNRMRLVRMVMTCCAADAKPVAALVEFDQLPTEPDLSWVRIVGTPVFPTEGGRTLPVIKVNSITLTEPPDETMLY